MYIAVHGADQLSNMTILLTLLSTNTLLFVNIF